MPYNNSLNVITGAQAYEYTKQEMFLKRKWELVKNFDEFKSYIENNGLQLAKRT